MSDKIIPNGYKLVPMDCDDDIAEAIAANAQRCGGGAYEIWVAALAAASDAPQIEVERKFETLGADLEATQLALASAVENTRALRRSLSAMIQQFANPVGQDSTDRQRQVVQEALAALSVTEATPPPSHNGEDDFSHREQEAAGSNAQPPVGWVHCSPAWLHAGGNCGEAERWHAGGAIGPHFHPPVVDAATAH
ncbi:hypothetical protein [Pseudomonas sp. NPDC096950]|uniref:hypothetical protein n=1 Tax=Pseudomonas sp. NPDC096950 TaxID=3364485 RepID=UPI00383B4FEF